MKLGERARWLLALAGPLLLEISSLMPMFGGAAKHWYRCRGRQFTGSFDDCFNDYLPIVELALPFFCLLLLYPFSRLAFSLFAPDPERRFFRWRLATGSKAEDLYPTLHAFAVIGAVWAVWRAFTYPIIPQMWPYLLFWCLFAIWFLVALAAAWPRKSNE